MLSSKLTYLKDGVNQKRNSCNTHLRANGRLTNTVGAYFFCLRSRYFSCSSWQIIRMFHNGKMTWVKIDIIKNLRKRSLLLKSRAMGDQSFHDLASCCTLSAQDEWNFWDCNKNRASELSSKKLVYAHIGKHLGHTKVGHLDRSKAIWVFKERAL